jgi:hypothetical protein
MRTIIVAIVASAISLFWGVGAMAAEPVAKPDREMPGLRLEVQELKLVSGGALILRFTVINGSRRAAESSARSFLWGVVRRSGVRRSTSSGRLKAKAGVASGVS